MSAIQPLLDAIDAVATHDDVFALLPTLHRTGIGAFFMWATEVDHDDSSRYLLWLAQGGLGLPDRDAYFDETPNAALREAYVHYVAAPGERGRVRAAAASAAEAVLALETRLAEVHLRKEERRDPDRTLNRHDLAAPRRPCPRLDLPGYLVDLGAGAATTVNVENPTYFAALHDLVLGTDSTPCGATCPSTW